MADTLEIFGTEYTGVTGIKATDDNDQIKVYIRPQGTKSISANGTGIDVTEYASVNVAVPSEAPTIQSLTVAPSTTQQSFNASNVDVYKPVTVSAVSQTNLTADNIKSGTTVTISNGTSNLWSVTGTYSGGSISVASTTWTNSSTSTVTHEFTGLSGTPKFAVLRCTTSMARSSSSTNYHIADIVWNGTSCVGNSFRRSNGTYANVTSGYTASVSGSSITFTSSGTATTNPGSYYNGTYELIYVY